MSNYSILGNTDRALHAHIHPRYDSEKPEHRRMPPFVHHWLSMPAVPFDIERDNPLMERLKSAIEKRT